MNLPPSRTLASEPLLHFHSGRRRSHGDCKHIARDNRSAAVSLLDCFDKFQLLATHNQIGTLRTDLADILPNLRTFSVGNYVIFFQPTDYGVRIVRVLHSARDTRSALSE